MPLAVTEKGTINIKGSRGSLDSIIHHFNLGSTAEQFVQRVPSLDVNAHQVGFSNASKSYACRNALESFMVDV